MREPTFAERMGIANPKEMQINGMNRALHNGLWNIVSWYRHDLVLGDLQEEYDTRIWVHFLNETHDTFEGHFHDGNGSSWLKIRAWFFRNATPWFRIYELLEFIVNLRIRHREFDYERMRTAFLPSINELLERENAGYRLVGSKFAPITNAEELQAIDEAIQSPTSALRPVSMHVQQALDHLSDREHPDYRNSIKESISAVEALCRLICAPIAPELKTLGPLLEKTTRELGLNPDLRDGFKLIYKYTNDDDGIRHALKDEGQPSQEDARFMLITCSAFVNYITEKARKQGKFPA
jgi:hypothetical protein